MKNTTYQNTFQNAISGYWTNAFKWGRATRTEYWVAAPIYNILIPIILFYTASPALFTIYSIIMAIPSFTLCVRRLHDIDTSAYAMLLLCLGPIGGIFILIMAIIKGDEEANIYGEPRI